MAQIGWWEADFKNQKYTLSEFIVDLLGLESDTIEFKDLHNLVHEDYRDKLREASLTLSLIHISILFRTAILSNFATTIIFTIRQFTIYD